MQAQKFLLYRFGQRDPDEHLECPTASGSLGKAIAILTSIHSYSLEHAKTHTSRCSCCKMPPPRFIMAERPTIDA
eukprot:m.316257 g.316257  ORF g.316257 m.316257 type:complete len:75 (+) comp893410_c0_seq1:75-299(+)